MEGTMPKYISEEIQSFLDRLTVLSTGTKCLDDITNYDYTGIVIKIKFLAVAPLYKTTIISFLKSTALQIIDHAFENSNQIIAGVTQKAKYGKPTGIKAMQLYGSFNPTHHIPDEFMGYEPVTEDDILYAKSAFLSELTYYLNHLKPIVIDTDDDTPADNAIVKKIKTNLSLDELAMLFKILNEYDDAGVQQKKILQGYKIKRDLHRAVTDSFVTIGSDEINLVTYETRYGTAGQVNAVEFWSRKFLSLKKSADRLEQDLTNKRDKTRVKKR